MFASSIGDVVVSLYFLIIFDRASSAYDKTVSIPLFKRLELVNLNDWDVPVSDRTFVHLNIRTCGGVMITFQTFGNITTGPHLVVQLRSVGGIVINCISDRGPKCDFKPAKKIRKKMYACNRPFLMRANWGRNGRIELYRGSALDEKGKQLISHGGGPKMEELLLSYETWKNFSVNIIAVGKLTSEKVQVNATHAIVLPYNHSRSLHLVVPETTPIGSVLHNLTEFENEEVTLSRSKSDTGVIDANGTFLTLAKKLDFEEQRTFYFQMTLRGVILTLKLWILLRVTDVLEMPLTNQLQIVEELPVGTIMPDWLNPSASRLKDKLIYKIINNNYFKVNESTGEITLTRRIDRDGKDGVMEINLTSTVTDNIVIHYIYSIIIVIDVNDNPPLFDKGLYRLEIPFRRRAVDRRIIDFKITDLDEDQNSGFDLSIENGNKQSVFYLKGQTLYANMDKLMNVKILKSRDWTYFLTIKATDHPKRGRPLSSQTVLFLIIEPPADRQTLRKTPKVVTPHIKFRRMPNLKVPETTSIGTGLGRLRLQLPGFQYSLYSTRSVCTNGKLGSDYFGMEQNSGALIVGARLDADEETGGCPLLELMFNITDPRTGTIQTFAKMIITITNVNDNSPKFNQTLTKVVLPCNLDLPDNFSLAALTVSDAESTTHVSMQFDSRNRYKYRVKYDGAVYFLKLVTTRSQFVHKEDADIVKIIAVDEGKPQLTSTSVVVIRQDCVHSFPGRTTAMTVEEDVTTQSSTSSTNKLTTYDTITLFNHLSSSKEIREDGSLTPSSPSGTSDKVEEDRVSDSVICKTYRVDPKTSEWHQSSSSVTATSSRADGPSTTLEEDLDPNLHESMTLNSNHINTQSQSQSAKDGGHSTVELSQLEETSRMPRKLSDGLSTTLEDNDPVLQESATLDKNTQRHFQSVKDERHTTVKSGQLRQTQSVPCCECQGIEKWEFDENRRTENISWVPKGLLVYLCLLLLVIFGIALYVVCRKEERHIGPQQQGQQDTSKT